MLIKMPHAARMPLQKTAASSRKTALGPLCKALTRGEGKKDQLIVAPPSITHQ
jgi:hypothetical protein